MKRFRLLLLGIFTHFVGMSQVVPQQGSEWHYGIYGFMGQNYNYETFVAGADTSIGGKLFRIVEQTRTRVPFVGAFNPQRIYLNLDSGKVLLYNKFTNSISVYADFSLPNGATWTTTIDTFPVTLRIANNRMDTSSGQPRRRANVQVVGGSWSYLEFLEGIGGLNAPIFYQYQPYNYIWIDGGGYDKLTCFNSQATGLLKFTAYPCDTTFMVAAKNLKPSIFSVYPNPSTGTVTVQPAHHGAANLIIRNLEGKIVLQEAISTSQTVELTSGFYTVQLTQGDWVEVKKLLVK